MLRSRVTPAPSPENKPIIKKIFTQPSHFYQCFNTLSVDPHFGNGAKIFTLANGFFALIEQSNTNHYSPKQVCGLATIYQTNKSWMPPMLNESFGIYGYELFVQSPASLPDVRFLISDGCYTYTSSNITTLNKQLARGYLRFLPLNNVFLRHTDYKLKVFPELPSAESKPSNITNLYKKVQHKISPREKVFELEKGIVLIVGVNNFIYISDLKENISCLRTNEYECTYDYRFSEILVQSAENILIADTDGTIEQWNALTKCRTRISKGFYEAGKIPLDYLSSTDPNHYFHVNVFELLNNGSYLFCSEVSYKKTKWGGENDYPWPTKCYIGILDSETFEWLWIKEIKAEKVKILTLLPTGDCVVCTNDDCRVSILYTANAELKPLLDASGRKIFGEHATVLSDGRLVILHKEKIITIELEFVSQYLLRLDATMGAIMQAPNELVAMVRKYEGRYPDRFFSQKTALSTSAMAPSFPKPAKSLSKNM